MQVAHQFGDRALLPSGDHLRGGGDDGPARTVVACKPRDGGIGMLAPETIEAGGIGPSEAVDRLVGIADDAQVRRSDEREQAVLLLIDVLELVDRDMREALAV